MNLAKGIRAIDLAIYMEKEKTLVLCDFHIGLEEALNAQGVLVPRIQHREITDRLEQIFAKVSPETIVINGDLKHEFGKISHQEWKETMRLLDYLSRKCKKLVLVKGNHDTILGPIAEKQNITITEEYTTGNTLVCHGNNLPRDLKNIKTIIIGHEHPAITLRHGPRAEKYKCYLAGKYKGRTLIVQPSFNLLTEGTDITKENLLSPLLKDITDFKVFVVDEKSKEVLNFGKLKELE